MLKSAAAKTKPVKVILAQQSLYFCLSCLHVQLTLTEPVNDRAGGAVIPEGPFRLGFFNRPIV